MLRPLRSSSTRRTPPRRMARAGAGLEVLLPEEQVAQRVAALADLIAPSIDERTVAVCLLTGGLWFASDLTRALARLGREVAFDALWLASYGDAEVSRGRCQVRADLQRPLAGRPALIVDDVVDSGLPLSEAAIDDIIDNQGRPSGERSLKIGAHLAAAPADLGVAIGRQPQRVEGDLASEPRQGAGQIGREPQAAGQQADLSLIHISEPTRQAEISYA